MVLGLWVRRDWGISLEVVMLIRSECRTSKSSGAERWGLCRAQNAKASVLVRIRILFHDLVEVPHGSVHRAIMKGTHTHTSWPLHVFGMSLEDLQKLQESWHHLSSQEQSSLLRHFLADGVVNQAIVFELRSCRERMGKGRCHCQECHGSDRPEVPTTLLGTGKEQRLCDYSFTLAGGAWSFHKCSSTTSAPCSRS